MFMFCESNLTIIALIPNESSDHNRFLNFHGESYARIERNFSVYGYALYPRGFLFRILSWMLFSTPDVHLKNLQKMWVDKILHKAVWQETLSKSLTEWQELVTAVSRSHCFPKIGC